MQSPFFSCPKCIVLISGTFRMRWCASERQWERERERVGLSSLLFLYFAKCTTCIEKLRALTMHCISFTRVRPNGRIIKFDFPTSFYVNSNQSEAQDLCEVLGNLIFNLSCNSALRDHSKYNRNERVQKSQEGILY